MGKYMGINTHLQSNRNNVKKREMATSSYT